MNKFSKKGFTLVELMVVVVILGALASIGMPYYFKTIETSKANDAIAIGHLLGNSNRMWNLDKGGANFATGQVTDACNAGVCPVNPPNTACNLVRCNYVARQDWEQSGDAAYSYYACNPGTGAGGPCCANNIVSCAQRKAGAADPYKFWYYTFRNSGRCDSFPFPPNVKAAPTCPKF